MVLTKKCAKRCVSNEWRNQCLARGGKLRYDQVRLPRARHYMERKINRNETHPLPNCPTKKEPTQLRGSFFANSDGFCG